MQKHAVMCMLKTTDAGLEPMLDVIILVQSTMVCMHKSIGVVWDP